ncbi:hypothetical protein COEREDRAFT_98992 [Coemansia reversa NRRL 1564]|uniref:LIM zinc-binding domain-containing protein n=1 Tax=Coemansia reversa (strain ATCC 12441 / NRRL 1564) TaxID=763665 RepID=A0A2G5B5N4_COERN|nr:hypothetical protein COEREDRAFT_98992 [Coemansia reversa NRRL 1564]|eukprot:PIA14353.1 hypothetical protein COEREDRAFT_98992 [Coemansia reversa NRRL 1564]
MFCGRCGEITGESRCKRCGGLPVRSTTGSAAADEGRKDPWSSTYLQRRLKPSNSGGINGGTGQRPLSTAYLPSTGNEYDEARGQRVVDRSPANGGFDRYGDLPLTRPRAIRDATGTRPSSMYAGGSILDGPVQSAIERTVQPKTSGNLRHGHSPSASADQSPRLRSKWSQYFTSTASPQVNLAAENGARGRSESMGVYSREPASPTYASAANRSTQGLGKQYSPKRTDFATTAYAQQPTSHQDRQRSSTFNPTAVRASPGISTPVHRPLTSDGNAYQKLGISTAPDVIARTTVHQKQSPSPELSRVMAARNVNSAFDTRKRTTGQQLLRETTTRTNSPLSPASDILRSRSATLPELHHGGNTARPCDTCNKHLKPGEQRQFASKPGVVFCADCYHSSYSRGHCAGCAKIVLTHGRPWVQLGEKVWHKLCIKCRTCQKMLISPLLDLESLPTCEPCFMKSHPHSTPRPMPTDSQLSSSVDAKARPSPQQNQRIKQSSSQLGLLRSVPNATSRPSNLGISTPISAQTRFRNASVSSDVLNAYGGESKQQQRSLVTNPPSEQHTADSAAGSIPTPALTEYDRTPSDLCNSPEASALAALGAQFHGMCAIDDERPRIMSPVEVAEKEGLPLPRHIMDPDLGAISRGESQIPPQGDTSKRSVSSSTPRPSSSGSRRSLPRSRNISNSSTSSANAIRSMINPSVTPIDTSARHQLLSPSLKNPNSPTARNASPRSVSFRIDEPPLSQSRIDEKEEVEYEKSATHNQTSAELYDPEQEQQPVVGAVQTKSLADYVLSKAGTVKPKSRLPSVAETIKKFSAGAFLKDPSSKASTLDKSQLPELQDMLRTHQRDPPTEPTIPPLDKHSKLLKSRPRNNNRRRPAQTPTSQEDLVVRDSSIRNDHAPQPEVSSTLDPEQFVPNQCARCTNSIEDTWFRLSDGRQVHVECFTCQGCDRLIDDGVYVLENNIEFHPQCVPPSPPIVSVSPVPSTNSGSSRLNTPAKPRGPRNQRREEVCDRCQALLSGPRFQLTNGKQYHPECFACAGCGQRFDEGSYVCFEGQEYHHQCVEKFANAANSGVVDEDAQLTCGECCQIIEGVFLRHNAAVFHPNCFCCSDCHRAITPGMPFGEIDAKPCCEVCLESRAAHQQQQQKQQSGWSSNTQPYPTKSAY